MTCLLGFEQGVYVFFVGVKGVVDVLAGLCLGVYFFVGVKGVDDVLAGVVELFACWAWSRVFTSSSLVLKAS